uniref:Uncharacterized protein n=1 Tax=Lepeophtheirus salmonis TaxID=72036 RepID=A0A0K2TA63_LEPSM
MERFVYIDDSSVSQSNPLQTICRDYSHHSLGYLIILCGVEGKSMTHFLNN